MRRLPALLAPFLLVAAGPPQAPDAGAAALAPDAEERWVPFELTPGNQVRFAMILDGRPVTAVLDTGVSFSVLSSRYARDHGMPVRPAGSATAIGGAVPIGWVAVGQASIGGLTRRGGGMVVADLPAAATGGGGDADLLVGRDLVGAAALDLDYPNHRLRLIASGRLPFAGATAPLWLLPGRQVYATRVRVGGREVGPVIVDTGDGAALTLAQPSWSAAGLDALPATTGVAFGVAGPIVIGLAVAPEIDMGEVTAPDVEVRSEAAGGFSETIGVAGRIGSGLLGRYRVLLDPGAERMVLAPGPDVDRPPVRSTSGLLLRLQSDRLAVLHVMHGGPAEAAGWRAGEAICAVDGAPVTAAAAAAVTGWTVGTPGRAVRLSLCGGPERVLTLRRFY